MEEKKKDRRGMIMKHTIIMSCGHEDTVELFGKDSAKKAKLEYFKKQGLCKACYKKKMDEENAAMPFTFNVAFLPYIDYDSGEMFLYAWFDGNTRPHKEDIKKIGYRWQESEIQEDSFDLLGLKRPPLYWGKIIKASELEEETKKALAIGIEDKRIAKSPISIINCKIAASKQEEWNKKNQEIALLEKPIPPDILKGRTWNSKIYGRKERYCVYFDGERVDITDEQAQEIQEYIEQKNQYMEKVKEIKNGII